MRSKGRARSRCSYAEPPGAGNRIPEAGKGRMVVSGTERVTDPYSVGIGASDDCLVPAASYASGTRAVNAEIEIDVVERVGRTDNTGVGEVRRRIQTDPNNKERSVTRAVAHTVVLALERGAVGTTERLPPLLVTSGRGIAAPTLRRAGDDLPQLLTLVSDVSLLGRERSNLVLKAANRCLAVPKMPRHSSELVRQVRSA